MSRLWLALSVRMCMVEGRSIPLGTVLTVIRQMKRKAPRCLPEGAISSKPSFIRYHGTAVSRISESSGHQGDSLRPHRVVPHVPLAIIRPSQSLEALECRFDVLSAASILVMCSTFLSSVCERMSPPRNTLAGMLWHSCRTRNFAIYSHRKT